MEHKSQSGGDKHVLCPKSKQKTLRDVREMVQI